MRVAVVGSGVAGLVAAYLLDARHEVEVFEADPRIGGHVNTVDVSVAGRSIAVDTGFIVYNEATYPNFVRLLSRLGVETQPTEMSFGLACERTGIEWASRGLGSVFAQRRNLARPEFLRMLRDVLRFNREARTLLDGSEKSTLGDYLHGAGYSPEFLDLYVVPMGAAIWSADPRSFLEFPATSFVRFFDNHGLLQASPDLAWRVVRGGSRRYVEALLAGLRTPVRAGATVRTVIRNPGGLALRLEGGELREFDRVVLAVHSDQALRLLDAPSAAESRVLSAIRYQPNEAVLHTDPSSMPRNRRAWASWNYRRPKGSRERVFVTYDMNRLQLLDVDVPIFVSLNPGDHVDPQHVLERIPYEHPVFDGHALAAQQEHDRIDGLGGVHYCGAYWGYGFHEDGVRSAQRVAQTLGGATL